MSKDIDLTVILKNCPRGAKFYSYIFGEDTYYMGLSSHQGDARPIFIYGKYGEGQNFCLTRKGHVYADNYGECCIFPSKDQRDWSKFTAPWLNKESEKFDPKTLKAFDKVIVKPDNGDWHCSILSHREDNNIYYRMVDGYAYSHIIPYNDVTKHLIGTTQEAPDFYKYWED